MAENTEKDYSDKDIFVFNYELIVNYSISTEDRGELTFKTFVCPNGTPLLGFQPEELRLWSVQRDAESDERWDSILEMENHIRLGGIGSSEIVYIDLYPN